MALLTIVEYSFPNCIETRSQLHSYWNFLSRNEDKLRGNNRLAMPYRTWDKMDDETQIAYNEQAEAFIDGLKGSKAKAYL